MEPGRLAVVYQRIEDTMKLILAALLLTAGQAQAGKFYDLYSDASSATLRVGYSGANDSSAVLTSSGAAVVRSTSSTSAHKPFRVLDNSGAEILSVTQGGAVTGSVNGSNIVAASIDTDKIKNGAVDTSKLATDSVTAAKVSDGAITVNKIGTDAVDTNKIASDSVTTSKVLTGAITTPKLGANSVDTGKINTDAVAAAQIINGAVTVNKIGPLAVDTGKIASGSVDTSKILPAAVDTNKLAADSVTATKIMNGSVTVDKIGALAVDTGKISAGAVDTGKILAGSVTGAKIVDGTIDTQKLNATIQAQLASIGVGAVGIASTQTFSGQNTFLGGVAFSTSSRVEGMFGPYTLALSADGATQSSGCVVTVTWVGNTTQSYAKFTSTTSIQSKVSSNSMGVLLESCVPGSVCRVGTARGIAYRVQASGAITAGHYAYNSSTRCQIVSNGATDDANALLHTVGDTDFSAGGWGEMMIR